jgi:hypothetical protein
VQVSLAPPRLGAQFNFVSTKYDLRPRKDGKGYDLISGSVRLRAFRWNDPELALAYAKFFGRLAGCRVRVFNRAGKLI